MATFYITEYSGMAGVQAAGQLVQVADARNIVTVQQLTTSTSNTQSAALNAATRFVRISGDADHKYAYGSAPDATQSDEGQLLGDNGIEYLAVEAGDKIAAATLA